MVEDKTWARLVDPRENVPSFSSSYGYKPPQFADHFVKEPLAYLIFRSLHNLLTVFIIKYVYGNQQHFLIDKARSFFFDRDGGSLNIVLF